MPQQRKPCCQPRGASIEKTVAELVMLPVNNMVIEPSPLRKVPEFSAQVQHLSSRADCARQGRYGRHLLRKI